MPQKVPLMSLTVVRDGKSLIPQIGKPFDFTDEEIEQFAQSSMAHKMFRDPIVEKLGEAPYRLPEGSEPLGGTKTASAATVKTGTTKNRPTKPVEDDGESL